DTDGMPIDEDPERASFREAHFSATLGGPTPLVGAGELGVVPGPGPPIPHDPLGLGSFAPPPSGGSKADRVEPWVTGRDGTVETTPLPPGRLAARVRHPQYVETMSEIVTVTSEKTTRVEIVLSRGG